MAVTGYEVRIKPDGGSYGLATDVGNVVSYQFTGLVQSTKYIAQVRAYDNAGNRSDWSPEIDVTTQSLTLSPTPLTITCPVNATLNFSQTGITGPVWTLEGGGSLTQTGEFTAPNTPQTVRIRVHSDAWEPTYDNTKWELQPDGRMKVIDDGPHYYNHIASKARLTQPGDSVTFTQQVIPFYFIQLGHVSAYSGLYIGSYGNSYVDYNPPANYSGTAGPPHVVGDVVTFQLTVANEITMALNGVVQYTSLVKELGAFKFYHMLPLPLNTIIDIPYFSGPGITGYTEYYADVTVV